MTEFSQKEVHDLIRTLFDTYKTPDYMTRMQEYIRQPPIPATEEALLNSFVKYQSKLLGEHLGSEEKGTRAQLAIQEAVKRFPNENTIQLLKQLCGAQEEQLVYLTRTLPELQNMADAMQAHANSHAHTHNHTHGVNPQQAALMQQAMQTLSAEQKEDLARMQTKMVNGTPPTAEDTEKMNAIQRQIRAVMDTFLRFADGGNGAGNAATAGSHGHSHSH